MAAFLTGVPVGVLVCVAVLAICLTGSAWIECGTGSPIARRRLALVGVAIGFLWLVLVTARFVVDA